MRQGPAISGPSLAECAVSKRLCRPALTGVGVTL